MAKQALVWTALPNGLSREPDGDWPRVSLFLSPRLHAGVAPDPVLALFPDFVDWPATLAGATFKIRYGNKTVGLVGLGGDSDLRVDGRLGVPDSETWRALFPDAGEVHVEGYAFRDLSGEHILSYPTAAVDALVRHLYTKLAASADGELPKVEALLADDDWGRLMAAITRLDTPRAFTDPATGVRNPAAQFRAFRDGAFKDDRDLLQVLARFQLFHTPAATPLTDKYDVESSDDARARARWLTHRRTELPKPAQFREMIDFHQVVAAMGQYPTLLRRLGLVVDFLVRPGAFTNSTNALLRVDVELPDQGEGDEVKREAPVSPQTRAILDANQFRPLSRPSVPDDYGVAGGLLALDKAQFDLLQSDVDGGGLKVMNFARSLLLYKGQPNQPDRKTDPVTRHKREIGAPALRNAGLMLVQHKRATALKKAFARQKDYDLKAEQLKTSQSGATAPQLFAEDLTRGWRIDIWDDKTEAWHSLCRREARYDFDGAHVVEVPEEEGCVRLAATKTPDKTSNPDIIWLHEALVSWTGWSLCAPPPGHAIHHISDPGDPDYQKDKVGSAEAEVPPGLHLRTAFRAARGSLPRLRYGRRYWLRARAVDLAGNSLDFSPEDLGGTLMPEMARQNARPYLRYEPISAPALALFRDGGVIEPPAAGESMERLAVRTFNVTPAGNQVPSGERARRVGVPSRTTHREAEHHGLLDRGGLVHPDFFETLKTKDHSLKEELIEAAGPLDDGPPVGVSYAVMDNGAELPYLPEPLALTVAARFFNHPHITSDEIIKIPFYPSGEWPNAQPFRIELFEGGPGAKPKFDKTARTLLVPLPKAERARLRLSVMPTPEALELLGVWHWAKAVPLTPAHKNRLRQLAESGQHWMLTPWRTIELVHAVQKPLLNPDVKRHDVERAFGSTFTVPFAILACHLKSTDHLDLLAEWHEPADDFAEGNEDRKREDHAFGVKITLPEGYAGPPEFAPVPQEKDTIVVNGPNIRGTPRKIHEFNDTRYRRVKYHFEATTAFREFMPTDVLADEVDDALVPTDDRIKVAGATYVSWVPSSAPPPAPEVLYVVPTFGWVRGGDATRRSTWRRGGGLRVYLDRPWNVTGYGEMLAVVLPPTSNTEPNTDPTAQPLKNFVTQWGNDPIWLSPFVAGAAPRRSDFPLARTAPDPAGAWLPSGAPQEEAKQRPNFKLTGLPHPELLPALGAQGFVEIAPHDVFYDQERRLWYCDIEIDWGQSYYPFVRLALARYQPTSVDRAHLSSVVLADFAALAPDRWVSVRGARQARTRRVTVSGFTYKDSAGRKESSVSISAVDLEPAEPSSTSVVEVWLERFRPGRGEDFGWERVEGGVVRDPAFLVTGGVQPKRQASAAKKTARKDSARKEAVKIDRVRAGRLLRERNFDLMLKEDLVGGFFALPSLWEGTVTLPVATAEGRAQRHRLAVAEYEEYLMDDAAPYDNLPTKKGRRLVFIEYVELD